MAVSLGLSIGEAFAELVPSSNSGLSTQRLHIARKGLTESLKEALAAVVEQGGEIFISTSLSSVAKQSRLNSAPAFLVTAGFEHWLQLQQPLASDLPTAFPTRAKLAVPDDHVFGIDERILATGKVDAAPKDEDLNFLASKLELLQTKTIAVGLLHSTVNPAHENLIRSFFESKGMRVFCSHDVPSRERSDESKRWRDALNAAAAWSALCEQKLLIEAALDGHREKWQLHYIAGPGQKEKLRDMPGIETELGTAAALAAAHPGARILHLDMEQFLWIAPNRVRTLNVQPTSPVARTSWPFAVYDDAPLGFEPGPMALGKALQPTAFDVLFVRERIEAIAGVTPILVEKTKARILEALFTMSKEMPSTSRIDPVMVATDLETALLDRINEALILGLVAEGEVLLTGALARSLHPRLEARRPDLRFKLAPEYEFAAGTATLAAGGRA